MEKNWPISIWTAKNWTNFAKISAFEWINRFETESPKNGETNWSTEMRPKLEIESVNFRITLKENGNQKLEIIGWVLWPLWNWRPIRQFQTKSPKKWEVNWSASQIDQKVQTKNWKRIDRFRTKIQPKFKPQFLVTSNWQWNGSISNLHLKRPKYQPKNGSEWANLKLNRQLVNSQLISWQHGTKNEPKLE